MRRFKVVITLSSGDVLERTTQNPHRLVSSLSKEFVPRQEYEMLRVLGLTSLVKGYIVSVKADLL